MKFSIRLSNSFRSFGNLSFLMQVFCLLIFLVIYAHSAVASEVEVNLQWDENTEPGISGYRVFLRIEGQNYNYDAASWEGSETTCTIGGLEQGVRYYFVARAFNAEDIESIDSNEATYYQSVPEPEPEPEVPEETNDYDNDGIIDDVDPDDDNDGLPDTWEIEYGLNPFFNDASGDMDGDGISNLSEYLAGSSPISPDRKPYQPFPVSPVDGSVGASLNSELRTEPFSDPNSGDTHYQTEWQISTDNEFSSLVFRTVSTICLEKFIIPELILEGDKTYYWRVRFFDNSNTGSDWSQPSQFTTDNSYPVDTNINGVPDDLEVDATVDLDNNGTPDRNQNDIKSMNTLLGTAQVGVNVTSGNGVVDSVQSIDWDLIADSENRPDDMPMDLIGFKLKVDKGAQVEVAIYFSDQLPDNAGWYKYDVQNGWQDFSEHAVFNNTDDGRTIVLLELKDGGSGDADGVENGVIVDPSGPEFDRLGLSSDGTIVDATEGGDTSSNDTTVEADQGDSGSSGGCFIASGTENFKIMSGSNTLLLIVIAFSGILCVRRK